MKCKRKTNKNQKLNKGIELGEESITSSKIKTIPTIVNHYKVIQLSLPFTFHFPLHINKYVYPENV